MWVCKECGRAVTVLAIIPLISEVVLGRYKNIIGYNSSKEADLENARVVRVSCSHCRNNGYLEEVAEWKGE